LLHTQRNSFVFFIVFEHNNFNVLANFKETQLANIAEKQVADIEIDAVPGKVFHGHVLSILTATGSATTLLPPDNATGNFTKVVQRVPVKISLELGEGPNGATAQDLKRVRQGMSVKVVIETAAEGGK
jgi:membrane fusion protein (multidrug efflux system)